MKIQSQHLWKTQRSIIIKIHKHLETIYKENCFTFLETLGDYKNVKSKIKVKCNTCNEDLVTNWFNIVYNKPKYCNKCKIRLGVCNESSRKFKREEDLKEYIDKTFVDYEYIMQGLTKINNKVSLALVHKICNNIYFPIYSDFNGGKSSCTSCSTVNFYNPTKYSTILSKVILDNKYTLITPSYSNFKKYIVLECNTCSTRWKPLTSDYLQNKSNCPSCSKKNLPGCYNSTIAKRYPNKEIFLYEFEIMFNNTICYKYGLSVNPKNRLQKLRQEMKEYYKDVSIELTNNIQRAFTQYVRVRTID